LQQIANTTQDTTNNKPVTFLSREEPSYKEQSSHP